jgi:hypothetical protein
VREHWEEDMTRRLVLFVPCGAMVRLSRPELSVPEEEAHEYEKVDLRKDLILWHHDFSGHLKFGAHVACAQAGRVLAGYVE